MCQTEFREQDEKHAAADPDRVAGADLGLRRARNPALLRIARRDHDSRGSRYFWRRRARVRSLRRWLNDWRASGRFCCYHRSQLRGASSQGALSHDFSLVMQDKCVFINEHITEVEQMPLSDRLQKR